ncbi:hypothetical protein FRB90_005983 [Tulasnella sp. 427]|nr:hypothetical protein FRB90_005983 [Tulasnella sp. 427]
MQSLTLKRKIKNPFAAPSPIHISPSSPVPLPSPSSPQPPPPVTPNTIHTFNTEDTDHTQRGDEDDEDDHPLLQHRRGQLQQQQNDNSAARIPPQREIEPRLDSSPNPEGEEVDRDISQTETPLSTSSQSDHPAPLRPRSPTRILPRRRNNSASEPSTSSQNHHQQQQQQQPTRKASDMSIGAASYHHPPSYFRKHRMSPSRDSWTSSLDISAASTRNLDTFRGTHTSDLADFLRSTGPADELPPGPPSSSDPATTSTANAAAAVMSSSQPAQPSKSGFTLRKYLKKSSSTSLGKKDGTSPSTASSTSLANGKRRFTAESFVGSSGSAAVTAAVNKALHNVPPPTNVQPKVFANGHTIYMINTPSPSTPSSDNANTRSAAASYAATVSTATPARVPSIPGLANKPQPPPYLRSSSSFQGTSSSSSATVVPAQNQNQSRPKTAGSGDTTPTPSTYVLPPGLPPVPSKYQQPQPHDALLVVPRAPHPHLHTQQHRYHQLGPRALSPIGGSEDAHAQENYDIQFDSADEREDEQPSAPSRAEEDALNVDAPAEVDASGLNPAISRGKRVESAKDLVDRLAEESEEDDGEDEEIGVGQLAGSGRAQAMRPMGSTATTTSTSTSASGLSQRRSKGSLSSTTHRRSESRSTLSGGSGRRDRARAGSIQSSASSVRRAESVSVKSAGSSAHLPSHHEGPSPTAARRLPPPTSALPPIPNQQNADDASPRMIVTAASPLVAKSSTHVPRDRVGSEGVSVPRGDGEAYRRDRSMSVGVRGNNGAHHHGDLAGLGLAGPPLNPPPAVPPPPTPALSTGPKTPVRTVKASEAPRSSARRAVQARPTVVTSDQNPDSTLLESQEDLSSGRASPVKTPTRRGSAPSISRASVQYILDPKTAPPVPSLPGGRDTFGGYVFPAAAESSDSEIEKDESDEYDGEEDEDDETTKLPESPSRSSVYLKEQLENVLKMNNAYLELATADKEARRTSKPPPPLAGSAPVPVPVAGENKTPVLGSPAEVISTRANKADSMRTVSMTSSRSAESNVSVGRINVAYVASPNGPPRLPLPPSPIADGLSPSHTLVQTSPLLPSGSPPTTIQAATSAQAQITTLTYALHTQRNRYEALSGHLCQQQALWDDERAAYETRLSEVDREKVDLVAEREQFAKRLQELEKDLAERDHRISQLESEKFAWERERKGLRWLVTSGRMGTSAHAAARPVSVAMSRSSSTPQDAPHMKQADSQATVISAEDEFDINALNPTGSFPVSNSDQTLRIDVTEAAPTPRRSNNSSSTAPSRPLSMMSVASQVSATSSRTSLDDGLLHPRLDTSTTSNKMKRHSMYEAATITTPSSGSRRPLSAALEDMLLQLRSLGEEEKDESHDEPTSRSSNNKKTMSIGMTTSRSAPLLAVTPKALED